MASVDFEIDTSGIIEICKSSSMRSVLKAEADKFASAANADALSPKELHVTVIKAPLYASAVDTLDSTCVGVAYTNSVLGGYNEAKRKSLSKQNH